MTSLIPLVLLAGYGYLVYRWALAGSAKSTSRRSKVTPTQENPKAEEAPNSKSAAARTAVVPY
jgi:hypothetical protein